MRCLAYIDLNRVRAGVVQHACQWLFSGYIEIQKPKQRYSLINRNKLTALLGIDEPYQLPDYHYNWLENVLNGASNQRDVKWTQSIAVGDKEFVMQTKAKLGAKAMGRKALENNEDYVLKKAQNPYSRVFTPKKCFLRPQKDYFWQASS